MRYPFISLILLLAFAGTSCKQRDLRGWWEPSKDGKTYFVLEDPDGKNCPPIFIDGQRWESAIGTKTEIPNGAHSITCGIGADINQGVGFEVRSGTIYHFDYWGP